MLWMVLLVFVAGVALPAGTKLASAQEMQMIRIATLAPRGSAFLHRFQRADSEIRRATNGRYGFQIFASGVAGDETDVVRKMKVGQMDGGIVTSTALASIVNEVGVMQVPGLIKNYKQVEAIQGALQGEWEQAFDRAGYKLVSWGEGGQYRLFSKEPITRPSDIRTKRPWLRPANPVLKEIWSAIGANGVPLDVPEVYGGLQTAMIDVIYSPSVACTALQWHTKLSHVSTETDGVLLGAMILTKGAWERIDPQVRETMFAIIQRGQRKGLEEIRRADQRAYDKLVQMGFTAVPYSAEGRREFDAAFAEVRRRLTGRVYTAELLQRVEALANAAR